LHAVHELQTQARKFLIECITGTSRLFGHFFDTVAPLIAVLDEFPALDIQLLNTVLQGPVSMFGFR